MAENVLIFQVACNDNVLVSNHTNKYVCIINLHCTVSHLVWPIYCGVFKVDFVKCFNSSFRKKQNKQKKTAKRSIVHNACTKQCSSQMLLNCQKPAEKWLN